MNLAAEIGEGLDSAKKARDLIYDPENALRGELYKIARRRNVQDDERDKARQDAINQGKAPVPPGAPPAAQATGTPVPLRASSATPGTAPATAPATGPATAFNPTPPLRTPSPPQGSAYARGGIVGVTGVDDMPVDASEGAESWDDTQAALADQSAGKKATPSASKGDLDSGKWLEKIMGGDSGGGPNSGGSVSTAPAIGGGTGETYAQGGMVGGHAFCPHCKHYLGGRGG